MLAAAVDLVETEGIDGLTMRRLASGLGVEAPSLYKHVSGKDELLDGVTEHIYSLVRLAADDLSWQEQIIDSARSFHTVLVEHPNAIPLIALRPITGETFQLTESLLERLVAAGLSESDAFVVLDTVVGYVVGVALIEVAGSSESVRVGTLPPDLGERYPLTLRTLLQRGHADTFEFGLRALVTGFSAHFSVPV